MVLNVSIQEHWLSKIDLDSLNPVLHKVLSYYFVSKSYGIRLQVHVPQKPQKKHIAIFSLKKGKNQN